jgi:lipid A ethanolaminephosphotransferase
MILCKNILFFIYLSISNIVFFSRCHEMVTLHKWKSLIIFLVVWAISVFSLWVLSYHPKLKVRIGSFIFLSIGTVFGYSYYQVSHHFLTFQDMELLWLAKAQAGQAIEFYFGQAVNILLISCVGLVSFIISPKPLMKIFKFKFVYWGFVAVPLLLLMGVTYKKAGYGTEGMPHQFSALSTFVFYQSYDAVYPSMSGERAEVKLELSKLESQDKNIVYIVDESIRPDYLDINQFRGTTPYLFKQKEIIANFGTMSSGNNCSGYANIILRTGAGPKFLGAVGKLPTIWSYAKKAGYKTVYLDGQQKTGVLQNFMDQNELALIDEFIQFEGIASNLKDEAIAKKIKEYQALPGKYFLYINKRGAHFPYNETFKVSDAKFEPYMKATEALGKNKVHLLNSYKNSIYTGVDKFFKNLLEGMAQKESIIYYTSDHGQNLMDRGIMTHCNTLDPHESEGKVPFFVISSNNKNKADYYKNSAKKSLNKLTHFHIFSGLLLEMGFKRSEVLKGFPLGLDGQELIPQEFTSGGIIPRFGKSTDWKAIKSNL